MQVEVYSNSDCLSESGDPTEFWSNRDVWLRFGLTGVVSIAPLFDEETEVVVPATGRGYVANKNKIIGMVRNRARVSREGRFLVREFSRRCIGTPESGF